MAPPHGILTNKKFVPHCGWWVGRGGGVLVGVVRKGDRENWLLFELKSWSVL